MKKKKTYSAEFKTRVILEILKEEDSLSSIASKYEITVQTLRKWKKQFLENASLVFDLNNATKEHKEKIEKLEKENDIKLMKRVDEIYTEISVYGYRRIHKQ
ncbi:transposase [Caminibacter sp.]